MSMRKTHDAVYAGEKYRDRNGEEKTRFINVGALFTREDGSLCVKIESIPVGFTGWINFYEPREREGQPASKPARNRDAQNGGFEDDTIPF